MRPSALRLESQKRLKIGNKVNIKVAKNKVAPPFKSAQVDIYYGEGISHVSEVISLGTELEIIDKAGAWFSYNGEKIGQGKEAVRAYLLANPQVDEEITQKIREKLFPEHDTKEEK